MNQYLFIWPIVHEDQSHWELISQAIRDLPTLAARVPCRLTGTPHFQVKASADVPGSGNLTQRTLVCQITGTPCATRNYRRTAA